MSRPLFPAGVLRRLLSCLLPLAALPATPHARSADQPPNRKPNFVLIYMDDMGYGDPVVFGGKKPYRTPNLDRLAAEGAKFTDFYVSSAVCSASRSAIMTGCYHERVGIRGALMPKAKSGLAPEEDTIADVLRRNGYATGMAGKWHLGDREPCLPWNQGFDESYGIPYSNDMWPHEPGKKHPPLVLRDGKTIIDEDVTAEDQTSLTRNFTERAVRFIHANQDRPFFFYLPHAMVHVPLFAGPDFAGKTKAGMFADVMEEVDWSVGEILKALKETGQDENTLVVFTSDNGPWLNFGNHAGSAGPLREGKGTSFEGGIRVPMLARWPGHIPAGLVCREPAMTIDLLPTFAALSDSPLPERKIDGKDITPLLTGEKDAKSPHEALFIYYANGQLQAMRSGPWKVLFPHTARSLKGKPPGHDGKSVPYGSIQVPLSLFHLETDIGEQNNLAEKEADVLQRLDKLADGIRAELGDSLRKVQGSEVRPAASLP